MIAKIPKKVGKNLIYNAINSDSMIVLFFGNIYIVVAQFWEPIPIKKSLRKYPNKVEAIASTRRVAVILYGVSCPNIKTERNIFNLFLKVRYIIRIE